MNYIVKNLAPDSDQVIVDVFDSLNNKNKSISIHIERDDLGIVRIYVKDPTNARSDKIILGEE